MHELIIENAQYNNMDNYSIEDRIVANYGRFYIPLKPDDRFGEMEDIRPKINQIPENGVCKDFSQLESYAKAYARRKTYKQKLQERIIKAKKEAAKKSKGPNL